MAQDIVSVIVPIYKVERYLDKCVESILSQTYPHLEIILVDDGSPDNCPAMCEDWAKRDSRIRVIHQTNGGLSAARNTGVRAAKGQWIGFVDSDDYIASDMYEKMMAAATENEADLCICGLMKVDDTGKPLDKGTISLPLEVMDSKQALSKLKKWYYVTAWNKLYRKSLFDKVLFPVGKLHEDEFLVHRIMGESQKVVSIPGSYYYYLIRNDSIMGNRNKKSFGPEYVAGVEACIDRYQYLTALGYHDLAKETLHRAYAFLCVLMKGIDKKKAEKALNKAVWDILLLMICNMDIWAVKLVLKYLLYCVK